MSPIVKMIIALVTIILAFCAVFIPPLALLIPGWIPAIGTGLSFLGIKSWRQSYDDAVVWFKSKSIVGALAVVLPMILLFVFPALDLKFLSEEVKEVLNYVLIGGGGLTLVGIFHALSKNDKNEIFLKVILILLMPSIFIGCTSSSLTFQTDQTVIATSEPQQLAEIVDVLYSGYETYEVNKGQKIDPLALTLELFPKLKEAIAGSKLALDEVTRLTDAQIISLANLGDKYNLGINKLKFKQVVKITLFLAQTYYVFRPVNETVSMVDGGGMFDGRWLMDDGRVITIDGGWNNLLNKRRIEKCLNGSKTR